MRHLKPYRWWLIIAGVVVLLLLGRRLYLNWQGGSGLAAIQQRGTLRVGLDASFPPFETLDENGQVVGLDADLAQAIAADLGVEVEFVNIGFDGLYDALKVGRVDLLLSGLPVDPFLTQDVAYSVNYFNAGQVLVTSDSQINRVEDLAGRTVAVEWGSLADMEARRLRETIPDLQIDTRSDPQAALQAEIAIVDGVTAFARPDLQRITYLTDDWYAAAVKLDNRALLAEVNRTLTLLIESGELDRLQDQWF
jgi:polar amino acid transport system substrate-binding protein